MKTVVAIKNKQNNLHILLIVLEELSLKSINIKLSIKKTAR
nr:hypothetical protein [Clostridium estertheticum]